jgi:hypothetical protein
MQNKKSLDQEQIASQPEKKKRRLNSKAKGASFEGTVAKKLSSALHPLKFIKTPGSGARVGGKNFELFGHLFGADAMKIFVGDVVPTNERDTGCTFKFSVECKSYKASDSFETLVAGNANIFKWMQESIVDAQKIQKIPLLLFKWNHTPIYVAALAADAIAPNPRISLEQGPLHLHVFYLDDLLQDTQIWVNKIEQQ